MKAFISYSHKDEAALNRFHTHLALLKRDGQIEAWYDREILAGGKIDDEINNQLESCELFVPLVSPDFLASKYCYEREMTRALERHEAGEMHVVPIIIQPCDWISSPLMKLKALPKDGKPVSEWTNENNAYLDVVNELRRIIIEANLSLSNFEMRSAVTESRISQKPHRYRVQRDFDEIDRSDYREKAFDAFRNYFKQAISEIDSIEGLRGRFIEISASMFGCTIVNKSRDHGTAHITVHRRGTGIGFGDISYSWSENTQTNTSNGSFNIEADEYELYLTAAMFSHGNREKRYTPESAASELWTDFLQQAGISYD